ncbi:MAG: amino acid adenylation domain-containing protein, partial [Candidatus Tectomicrobia bacterium]|nr:amino acid adenylation domain-containing protein [Candidatus Tectomicrobia bacterium]
NLMNPVVVHGDMSDSPLFTDFLAQVQRAVRGALLHQEYPFSLLIKQFQPQQDFNYAPIAQVFFNMPLSPRFTEFAPLFLPEQRREKVPWGGMELESFYIPQQEGQFLLGFDVWKMDDTLLVTAKYNTDVFDAETIMRMGGHYQTLLEGIVTHPRESISHLPLLTEAERQQVLVQWNRTESAGLATACFHHLFEAQVERTPEAEAVVSPDDGRRLTYRELNRRANQLAHYLKPLGAGSDVLIGICMERSVDMVVALLGVLKAGAAYVPLDPSYPSTRLAFMLEDAEVPILLTQEKLVATLPGHLARVICIDKNWDRMAQESEHNLVNDVVPEDLAYCIFTSGSTGRSKGVLITHGSFVNAHLAWAEAYRLRDACTSVLQMANFAWDVFSGDLARTLLHGAKLVLCPREWLLAPEALYHLMREEQVDCAEFVPVLLRNLVQHLEQTGQDLSFMRLLIAGSDSWYMEEYHKFQQFCGAHTRLINSYGITEATIDSSYFEGTDTLVSRDGGVPIGRPFANTQLYILDPHLQPVPIGGIGELHVGGANIARGYLNRPELTKEKFIPNPFGPTDRPGRLYKTGDKARYLRDGNIEFLGRIDDQLKIRGFRVEPGEIEAALSQHAKVSATVVATQEGPSGKRLVAYVVPEADPVDTGDLLAHLKDTLPAHMIPAAIVVLESLPLTPNGKVDRRALPAPD